MFFSIGFISFYTINTLKREREREKERERKRQRQRQRKRERERAVKLGLDNHSTIRVQCVILEWDQDC